VCVCMYEIFFGRFRMAFSKLHGSWRIFVFSAKTPLQLGESDG
jgi:hypothetical protein